MASQGEIPQQVAIRYYQSLRCNGMNSAEAAERARKLCGRLLQHSQLVARSGQQEALTRQQDTRLQMHAGAKNALAGGLITTALLLVTLAVSNFLVQQLLNRIVTPLGLAIISSKPSSIVIADRDNSYAKNAVGEGLPDTSTALLPVTNQLVPASTSSAARPHSTVVSHQTIDWQQADRYYFYFTQPGDRREPLEEVLHRLARYFGPDCGVDLGDGQAVARFAAQIKQSNPGLSTSRQLPSVVKIPILTPQTYAARTAWPSPSSPRPAERTAMRDVGDQPLVFSIAAQGGPAIQHNLRTFFENRGSSWRIPPGQEASLNQHFGPYGVAQGMMMGSDDVGDGVCNAASMLLYRAAESGLEVRATQPGHAQPIPGVPPEHWVTIYYAGKDAWVRNPFEHPVEIRWQIDGDTVAIGVEVEMPPSPAPAISVAKNPDDAGLGATKVPDQPQTYSAWFEFLRTFFETGSLPNLEENLAFVVEAGPYQLSLQPINITISDLLKQTLETITGETIVLDEFSFWIGEGFPSNQLMPLVQAEELGYHNIITAHEDNILGFPLAAVGWWTYGSNRGAGLLLHGHYNDDGSFNVNYLDTSELPIPEFLIPKQFRDLRAQFVVVFAEVDEQGHLIRTYR